MNRLTKLTRTFFAGATAVVLALGIAWAQTTLQRPLNPQTGFSAGVTYVSGADPTAGVGGEVIVCRDCGDDGGPEIFVWDAVNSEADKFLNVSDAQTVSGAFTFSAAAIFNGDLTVGSDGAVAAISADTFTVNSRFNKDIVYEDFDIPCRTSEPDLTVVDQADTKLVLFECPDSGLKMIQRLEIAAALDLWDTGQGYWDLDGDLTENDGQHTQIGVPASGVELVKVATTPAYFVEASITIDDVTQFDADWAFGWNLTAALPDTPQHDGFNTYGVFTLQDGAGDLDVECDVDAGGELAYDAVVWADGETKILRVVMNAAGGYTFYLDGVAVTAASCDDAGANEATDADYMTPFIYHTVGGTSVAASGFRVNYIAHGKVSP